MAELLEAMLHETGYIEALEAERTVEAEGRIENLEELVGVAGEFDANRELEGDSDVSAAGGVPGPDLARHRAGRPARGGEPGDADVAPQRQGPRVRGGVRDRLRGGRLPALALARGGQRRGGAPARYVGVTRARERLWLTYARRRSLHGGASWNLPSRFLDELPERAGRAPRGDHADRLGPRRRRRAPAARPASASAGAARASRRRRASSRAPPPVPYSVGDDVVHASFGEGVVTAVEPGSVVVVRFAGDGAERKLMADYAPLKRVA